MSPPNGVGLPEALERAASALDGDADAIRPANGDPDALLGELAPDAATRARHQHHPALESARAHFGRLRRGGP